MNIKVLHYGRLVLWVAVFSLLLGVTNVQAVIDGVTGTSFNLTAKADQISTADSGSILMWGYSDGAGRAQYPGPTLIVNQGDVVTVTLTNSLTVTSPDTIPNVSIVFPGLQATVVPGDPGVEGILTNEAVPGGTVTYTFTASNPGTYHYHSGTDPQLQIEMGLVGAIIVRSALGPNYAYNHADSYFDHEYLFLLSEMDPNIHQQVVNGMASTIDNTARWPVYWFINGRTAPDTIAPASFSGLLPTQPYNSLPRMRPGEKLLLRIINAGRDLHPFHTHGNHMKVIARDGRLLASAPGMGPNLATQEFTLQSVPGETADAVFTWSAKGLGWDIYGDIDTVCTDVSPRDGYDDSTGNFCHDATCTDTINNETLLAGFDGFDDATYEWCGDHGTPIPVTLPNNLDLTFGAFYSGSPYMGSLGLLPPGQGGLNPNFGFTYMWHSHTEKEIINFDIFPGGMLTMLIIEPPWAVIP